MNKLNANHIKIYIIDYLPKDLLLHLDKLSKKLIFTKKYYEIVTNYGIIHIDCGNMNMLKFHDFPIEKKGNFLLDRSRVTKKKIYSQIPYHHFINENIVNYYENSSNIQLVIEGIINNSQFEIKDFYFLANDSFDFDNKIIAEEIEWFLSVLK